MTNGTIQTTKDELVLCVFIDALGWEILLRRTFLDDFLTTKAPLETVFGYSSTCDPTILTGKRPREHGHFSFFYYNPSGSPFGLCRVLALLPRFITRRGRVRRLMSRFIKRLYGYTGYFQLYNMPFRHLPLFDYSEKRDLYEPGGINSGAATVFDYLRDNGIPFHLSDWRISEEENLESLELELEKGEIRFGYLYLAAMDAILHADGAHAISVDKKIRWYEERLGKVIDVAQRNYGEVKVHVFSDHGMTDVVETCDLIRRIDALGLRFGVDYAAVYDSTMARFWFLNDLARERIVQALKLETRGQILSEAKLAEYGCDFSENTYGDLFFLLDPGVLLCPSFMGEAPLAGMHGYAPEHKGSVASYMSNAAPDPLPHGLEDLYGLMLSELQPVQPAKRHARETPVARSAV